MKAEYIKLLEEIKIAIQKSKVYHEGVVEGIVGSRIGFIKIASIKKSFVVSPYEMDKVLPGDKVKILVQNDGKKENVEIVEVLESTLKTFTGRFTEDETGCYIIPDVLGLNRKVRIPKSYRKKAKLDDFVEVEILDHPFHHKKPKAKVLEIIGASSDDLIAIKYTVYKNKINETFSEEALKEVKIFDQNFIDEKGKERKDLRHINFVTIDSESTNDYR